VATFLRMCDVSVYMYMYTRGHGHSAYVQPRQSATEPPRIASKATSNCQFNSSKGGNTPASLSLVIATCNNNLNLLSAWHRRCRCQLPQFTIYNRTPNPTPNSNSNSNWKLENRNGDIGLARESIEHSVQCFLIGDGPCLFHCRM
jgi:hypothetical protein